MFRKTSSIPKSMEVPSESPVPTSSFQLSSSARELLSILSPLLDAFEGFYSNFKRSLMQIFWRKKYEINHCTGFLSFQLCLLFPWWLQRLEPQSRHERPLLCQGNQGRKPGFSSRAKPRCEKLVCCFTIDSLLLPIFDQVAWNAVRGWSIFTLAIAIRPGPGYHHGIGSDPRSR